jgi:hypothetical protein
MVSKMMIKLLIFAFLIPVSWGEETKNPIQFIYIHGSNQNNYKSRSRFNESVSRLHPQVIKAATQEPLIQTHLLENGENHISPKTLNFFWGDRSYIAIEAMKRNLLTPQLLSGFLNLAERARIKLNYTLHDAIWLEKDSNKKGVLNDLFNAINDPAKTNQKTPFVLMGHSAGSLLAFNLLLYRLPYLDIQAFATELKVTPETMAVIGTQANSFTCLEALMSSSAIRYNAEGNLTPFFKGLEPTLPNYQLEAYRNQWLENLPLYTKLYCLPPERVKGIVTFGSPLILFYSTVADPKKDENYLTANMMRYMMGHHIFWLHINHFNDFIGVPLPGKKQILSMIQGRLGLAPLLDGGFLQNKVCLNRGANVLNAHSWYWNKPKAFAQAIMQTYREGYQTWYPSPVYSEKNALPGNDMKGIKKD